MYANVQYYKGGFYAGASYTYETGLNLCVGDKVIAPTKNEPRQKAIVTQVNVMAPKFACRKIEEYDPDAYEVIL